MKFFNKNTAGILFFIIFICIKGYAEPVLLGDKSDGSRAVSVHLLDMRDETGAKITPTDTPLLPFSLKQTCNECHNYSKISTGFHFNYSDSISHDGRKGEPWILVDALSGTQIPFSHRNWSGLFTPEYLGLDNWSFIEKFGRHLPGGEIGEDGDQISRDHYFRWLVSGNLEINCMGCHDVSPLHDQAAYAENIKKQNYRWAAASACDFAYVTGSAKDMPDNYDIYFGGVGDDARKIPPQVAYNNSAFNPDNKVFFNITRDIPSERCYFCHSTKYENNKEKWETQQDIHLKSGMKCVDCHKNGLDHQIVRGYENESKELGRQKLASMTCKGCHIAESNGEVPTSGRMGAPLAEHKGLPIIHFEKLSCTACHSGPWPESETVALKTSRSHALGVHGAPKEANSAPYITGPVFANGDDDKITPQKMIFPSFWAWVDNDSLEIIDSETIRPIILYAILSDTLSDSTNIVRVREGVWPLLKDEQITAVFDSLNTIDSLKTAGFVANGRLYTMGANGTLVAKKHNAAQPYSWPIAHDVRPASQALGVRGCSDCHSLNAPFQFGQVPVLSILNQNDVQHVTMSSFQNNGILFPRLFALSFIFRPWLKLFLIICTIFIGIIILWICVRAVDKLLKTIFQKEW